MPLACMISKSSGERAKNMSHSCMVSGDSIIQIRGCHVLVQFPEALEAAQKHTSLRQLLETLEPIQEHTLKLLKERRPGATRAVPYTLGQLR